MKEYKLKINGNDYAVVVEDVDGNTIDVEVNGVPFKVEIDKPVKEQAVKAAVSPPAQTPVRAPAPSLSATHKPASATSETVISSPLPGVILEIIVKEGESVKKGQKLMVLEAMKMENVIESNTDGTVMAVKVNKGDSVLEGAPLVAIR